MGASILDRLNERNGTTDHTIAGALKSYIIRNGGDPTGLQSIADLVEALPEGIEGSGGVTPSEPQSSGGAIVYEITGTDSNASQIPAGFPYNASAQDFLSGNIIATLCLTETYQVSEEADPVVRHFAYGLYASSGLTMTFTRGADDSPASSVAILQMTAGGDISLQTWRECYHEATVDDGDYYSYYDYMQSDMYYYDETVGGAYYGRDGNEMEGTEANPLYSHGVTWKLLVVDNRSA